MEVRWDSFVGIVLVGLILGFAEIANGGITSSYVRNDDLSLDMPLDSDVFRVPSGYNAPQQVHITQGDHEGKGVIVSWVTPDEPGSTTVLYWAENSELKNSADGFILKYRYFNYTSGYIHHCTIKDLEFDTKYYYEVGIGNTTRQFWFITPPRPGPDVPYTFGLIGDLGQTHDSNRTVTHYELNPTKGQTLLFVGDLSYADDYPFHDNSRWDTWGRFTERSAAYQPWIWTAGNHEIDFVPEIGERKPFKPYTHRYHVPYRASGSTSPMWYSIKRASAYIIVLSSYSAYGLKRLTEREEKERVMQFLMGLNDSYSTIRGSILMMNPLPDTRRVHGLILQHERQMDVASRRDIGMNSHAMQVRRNPTFQSFNKQSTNTSSRKPLKCNYCDGDGHLVDHCYYIIGFPEGHRWHGKNVKPRNKRSMANNTEVVHSATRAVHTTTNSKHNTSVTDGPTFTTEEYNQIIAMLRSGNGQPSINATGKYTPQYKWLEKELPKVNRTETPWLIVLMHCPMYNSYAHHYMEGETMRVMYEPWFVEFKVDVVFAGHVHAYERSERISNVAYNIVNSLCTPIRDQSAPIYITIGDGGNREGLVTSMTEPQPSYSAFREPSFGHGILDIKNRTHAYFGWHRNQDGYAVEADSVWLHNRFWNPLRASSMDAL